MNELNALNEMEILAEENCLYDELYQGLPIYRLFRWLVCPKYIRSKVNSFVDDNSIKKRSFIRIIKSSFYSCFDILRIIISKKKYQTIFFPSFRLFNINGYLIDKFTDPIISETSLESSYIILQRSYYIDYRHQRRHKENLCQMEVLDYVTYFAPKLLYPFYCFTERKKEIDGLINRIDRIISIDKIFRKRLHCEFLSFMMAHKFYKFFLERIGCSNIFVVIKGNNYPQILAAHQLGLKVYEIQHGVTMDKSILYGGKYNAIIDPDAFLTFGDMWKGPQFGVPIDSIINIGFAYKNYIQKQVSEKKNNSVLVVSSPEITDSMVRVTTMLASVYSDMKFYFRTHPHEGLTNAQLQQMQVYPNVRFSDKSVDSNLEVLKYPYVIGTNSSVLFEASSLGVKVGRLCFAGLESIRFQGDENFYYLNSISGFRDFLQKETNNSIQAYSTFNKDLFLSLIK